MFTSDTDFYFNDMEVGHFVEGELPKTPGQYRYMPYRGSGRYEMQTNLAAQGNARCSYRDGGKRVMFTVSGSPKYGVLELRDFEPVPSE